MFCEKCGKEVNQEAGFCRNCGEKNIKEILSIGTADVKNKKPAKKSPLVVIVSVIFFILAFVTVRYLTREIFSSSKNTQSSTSSTESLIKETVKEIKKSMALPVKFDEGTTVVDVTAEPKAIRYHYVLSNVDPSQLSNDYFKNHLISGICKNNDTKDLLNQGINMEYSYVVKGTQQTYFALITKSDCSL